MTTTKELPDCQKCTGQHPAKALYIRKLVSAKGQELDRIYECLAHAQGRQHDWRVECASRAQLDSNGVVIAGTGPCEQVHNIVLQPIEV